MSTLSLSLSDVMWLLATLLDAAGVGFAVVGFDFNLCTRSTQVGLLVIGVLVAVALHPG